ncbi:hypothetical protein LCGC14_1193480 [marine sediment metagenome]|uniref:Uncharacterized protein n=1 Tax=marine sediment metagenome TaxID=412755 RepID=A0A0F9LIY2_9ZZZZ
MTTAADFKIFQAEFRRYQALLGLNGYTVYFKHEADGESFASISVNHSACVATVRYNSDLPEKDKPHADPKKDAKHEAIHLLLARLEGLGRSRFTTESSLYEATEEAVNKLASVIP